jgi:hypothetical protein
MNCRLWQRRGLSTLATNKQTIERLLSSISALAVTVGVKSELTIIAVPSALDENAVIARHYELHPRDAQSKLTVFIRRFGDPDPDAALFPFEDPKISQAWRELAREERPLRFWDVPPDALPQ